MQLNFGVSHKVCEFGLHTSHLFEGALQGEGVDLKGVIKGRRVLCN